jgi:hypothetical protein
MGLEQIKRKSKNKINKEDLIKYGRYLVIVLMGGVVVFLAYKYVMRPLLAPRDNVKRALYVSRPTQTDVAPEDSKVNYQIPKGLTEFVESFDIDFLNYRVGYQDKGEKAFLFWELKDIKIDEDKDKVNRSVEDYFDANGFEMILEDVANEDKRGWALDEDDYIFAKDVNKVRYRVFVEKAVDYEGEVGTKLEVRWESICSVKESEYTLKELINRLSVFNDDLFVEALDPFENNQVVRFENEVIQDEEYSTQFTLQTPEDEKSTDFHKDVIKTLEEELGYEMDQNMQTHFSKSNENTDQSHHAYLDYPDSEGQLGLRFVITLAE